MIKLMKSTKSTSVDHPFLLPRKLRNHSKGKVLLAHPSFYTLCMHVEFACQQHWQGLLVVLGFPF